MGSWKSKSKSNSITGEFPRGHTTVKIITYNMKKKPTHHYECGYGCTWTSTPILVNTVCTKHRTFIRTTKFKHCNKCKECINGKKGYKLHLTNKSNLNIYKSDYLCENCKNSYERYYTNDIDLQIPSAVIVAEEVK